MRTVRTVASLAVLLWPALALACPVCFNARDASRLAFLWTAILMTLLPLGLVGGTAYWLWRRVKAQAGEDPVGEQKEAPR